MNQLSPIIIGNSTLAFDCALTLINQGITPPLIISDNNELITLAKREHIEHHSQLTTLLGKIRSKDTYHFLLFGATPSFESLRDIFKNSYFLSCQLGQHSDPLASAYNAIINELPRFNVSWQRYNSKHQAFSIVAQTQIAILPDETSSSLLNKANKACLLTFRLWLHQLNHKNKSHSYWHVSKIDDTHTQPRHLGFISPDDSALQIARTTRALSFNQQHNSFYSAKILINHQAYIIKTASIESTDNHLPAGQVLRANQNSILITTTTQTVALTLSHIDGQVVTKEQYQVLAKHQTAIQALPISHEQKLDLLYARIRKSERYWQKKLAQLSIKKHHKNTPVKMKTHHDTELISLLKALARCGISQVLYSDNQIQNSTRKIHYLLAPFIVLDNPANKNSTSEQIELQLQRQLQYPKTKTPFSWDIFARYKTLDITTLHSAWAIVLNQDTLDWRIPPAVSLHIGEKLCIRYQEDQHQAVKQLINELNAQALASLPVKA